MAFSSKLKLIERIDTKKHREIKRDARICVTRIPYIFPASEASGKRLVRIRRLIKKQKVSRI